MCSIPTQYAHLVIHPIKPNQSHPNFTRILHPSEILLTLLFFSFHPGRTVSVLCRRVVWRNRGSWHQRRETSENLCSSSWGGWDNFFSPPAQVDLRSIDHVYKNQFGKHLDKLVREETGGHYRNTLLGLLPHGRSRWVFIWWVFIRKLTTTRQTAGRNTKKGRRCL